MRFLALSLLSILASACAPGGEKFSPRKVESTGKALVYVYRSSDHDCSKGPLKSGDPHFLFINDKRVFAFRCNTHTALELDPGAYRFSIKANVFYLPTYERKGAQVFEFAAGKTYYVWYREDYAFTDTALGRPVVITNSTFEKTEGDTAPTGLSETRYVASDTDIFK